MYSTKQSEGVWRKSCITSFKYTIMELLKKYLFPGGDNDTSGTSDDAIEDDGTPVLDQKDLEENNLSDEEAEQIVWDEPKEAGK